METADPWTSNGNCNCTVGPLCAALEWVGRWVGVAQDDVLGDGELGAFERQQGDCCWLFVVQGASAVTLGVGERQG